MPYPNRIIVEDKKTTNKDPPHPCDPALPCDPCEDKPCNEPKLCKEKIKNPVPGWQTKCKSGLFLNAATCNLASQSELEPHPCDPEPPCTAGKPKVAKCPEPALDISRIKNPVGKMIRCPSEQDQYSPILCQNKELLLTPIPVCKDEHGRPKIITINPFDEEDEIKREIEAQKEAEEKAAKAKPKRELPDHLYQDTLCKYKELLKTPIKSCMQSPCQQTMVFDPDELELQAKENEKEFMEPDKDPCANKE